MSLRSFRPRLRRRLCGRRLVRGTMSVIAVSVIAASGLPASSGFARAAEVAPAPLLVRVLVVNLFSYEAEPWRKALEPTREIPVPGLPPDNPAVRCTADGVCEMATDMGHANAAASMMAVLYSGLFDLSKAYVLVAGIAGIDPARGTIGSVAWARYAVDGGILHEIDARERPPGWPDGFFGVMTDSPLQTPKFEYHSEVFRLDEALLQRALGLSKSVVLEDAADVKAYRSRYPAAPADQPPAVIQCDTLSSDTWWAGEHFGVHARHWTSLVTAGKGNYCTSQQEDNAVLTALTRAAPAGIVDLNRVAILRSGSDFDRPYPHQTTLKSLQAQRTLQGAGRIAVDNLVIAGMPLVTAIRQHWSAWQDGVPAPAAP